MREIQGLDHVIILVRDLEAALERMRRLGFHPTPRALHSATMGTANSTLVFGDGTYVELMTVLAETPLNRSLATIQYQREGLIGIAMKTDDARAAAAAFEVAHVSAGAAADFSRPVELPGGVREAAFTIARLDPEKTPGAWMFVCQHHTPDVVWRGDCLDHPNGAAGLAEVVGVATDLGALERAYRPIFGDDRLRRSGKDLTLDAAGPRIVFLSPPAFAARFGKAAPGPDPRLAALSLRTRSIDRIAELVTAQRLPFLRSEQGCRFLLPPSATGGWTLEFAPETKT